MEMHSVEFLQDHEKTRKNQIAQCYLQWELNPGHDFNALHATV